MKKQRKAPKRDKILKVGFDLDGVLLYNPLKVARPAVAAAKALFFKARRGIFYIPRSSLQRLMWLVLHKSSLFIEPGYKDIKKLIARGRIRAYVVSGRYSFVQGDLEDWLKRLEAGKYFAGIYVNSRDEQPTVFKERIIKKLDLDVFIEDNWDVVAYLNKSKVKSQKSKVKIFWIYNIVDRWLIKYNYKFADLRAASSGRIFRFLTSS